MRTSIGLVTMGSDETLLREIDTRIIEWNKKSGVALSNGEIDDYRLHKIQVSHFYVLFILLINLKFLSFFLLIRSLLYKNGEDKLFLINNLKILLHVNQLSSSLKHKHNSMNHFQSQEQKMEKLSQHI
jgi:hypothetical protein